MEVLQTEHHFQLFELCYVMKQHALKPPFLEDHVSLWFYYEDTFYTLGARGSVVG